MRRSEAALAVIGREIARQPRWLARWNEAWRAFHFVGGHRDAGEAPRTCVVREIKEELGLDAGAGCWVAAGPLAHVEYTGWSARAGADTAYVMDLFAVVLDDSALDKVAKQPNTRWLTAAEVHDGRCKDGRPVSPTMTTLFDRAGIDLQRPQSKYDVFISSAHADDRDKIPPPGYGASQRDPGGRPGTQRRPP